MNFSQALELINQGKKLVNKGWNGKGMYVQLQLAHETSERSLPYIYMNLACGNSVPWQPSQYDMLRGEWEVIE